MKYSYSAILLTYNEESRIEPALENFHGRADIIVVDNYSTDRTVEIARKYTDKIVNFKNPGWDLPDLYYAALKVCETDYILVTMVSRFYPPQLLALFDRVARERRYKAVAQYVQPHCHGRLVYANALPYRNKTGSAAFLDKNYLDFSQAAIHASYKFGGRLDEIYFPPKKKEYCMHAFRDDDTPSLELKHNGYANHEAQQRFASGERTNLLKILCVFTRMLVVTMLWRRSLLQGMEGIVNSFHRVWYYVSIELRIWELQSGLTRGEIMQKHMGLKRELLASFDKQQGA